MDEITTRVVVIGVAIFVTLSIVTIVIVMFFQMQEIYGIVATTDTSIYSTFDNVYSMYNGRTMTGLGLLNTIKKYEDKSQQKVLIKYPGSAEVKKYIEDTGSREVVYLKSLMEIGKQYKYETKYNVTVMTSQQGEVTIIFDEI